MAWSDAARAAAAEARRRRASGLHKRLVTHSQFAKADYSYLRRRGHSKREILSIWGKDKARGVAPLKTMHKPFDIVGYLNKGRR